MIVPTSALITPCIPGCPSRIEWEYDSGEPQTRDYPGCPSTFIPVIGCSEVHLERLGTDYLEDHFGELDRQFDHWLNLEYTAWKLERSSRAYLHAEWYR